MSIAEDTEIPIELNGIVESTYMVSSQHRRSGNPEKTVWSIGSEEEVACFTKCLDFNWVEERYGWGLHILDSVLQYLGHNFDNERLKLAKFVDGNRNNIWHGYPADYLRRNQDRPPTFILKDWVEKGYLTKSKMIKIRKGQSCNL